MGLMDAVLRMVDRIRREQQLGPVRKITLEVGEMSGVVPRFLEECYEAVAAGTPFEIADDGPRLQTAADSHE